MCVAPVSACSAGQLQADLRPQALHDFPTDEAVGFSEAEARWLSGAALCWQLLSRKNWQGAAGPSLCLPLRSGPEALRRPLGPAATTPWKYSPLGQCCGIHPHKEGESPPGPDLVLGMRGPGALWPLPGWPPSFCSGGCFLGISRGAVGTQHLFSQAGHQGLCQRLDLLAGLPGPPHGLVGSHVPL